MKRIDALYQGITVRIEFIGSHAIMSAGGEFTEFTSTFEDFLYKLKKNNVKFELTNF